MHDVRYLVNDAVDVALLHRFLDGLRRFRHRLGDLLSRGACKVQNEA